ncbi:MAG TPA: hypothetical protein HA263_11485 [Methanoregulaceae archaeon]|nr:hypothetical protein [Methanoregulaceae archaeon]
MQSSGGMQGGEGMRESMGGAGSSPGMSRGTSEYAKGLCEREHGMSERERAMTDRKHSPAWGGEGKSSTGGMSSGQARGGTAGSSQTDPNR